MKTFYVYVDWTLEDIPRCYYVGKGDESRVAKVKRNKLHSVIVEQFGHRRVIAFTTNDENLALEMETKLIIEHHVHINDVNYNGIGCNMTMGGQGKSGRIVTKETRQKISDKKKGITPNKIWSQEERDATSKRMSLLHKGKKISDSHKLILSQRMADENIKNEMIEKVTNSIREKYLDDDFYQRIVDSRARGIQNGMSVFTEEEVIMIRADWEQLENKNVRGNTHKFCVKWASLKNVTGETIYGIIKRRTWKHVN